MAFSGILVGGCFLGYRLLILTHGQVASLFVLVGVVAPAFEEPLGKSERSERFSEGGCPEEAA